MSSNVNNNVFDILAENGIQINEQQKSKIIKKISTVVNYSPTIGLFGKTGAGKSSLVNALFGQEICKIDNIKSCTRTPQEVLLNIGNGNNGLKLLDVPGVGENTERDIEYSELYQKILPEIDLVLWVLKGDERAYSSDESFYQNIVKPHILKGKPFLIALNQVDKIDPLREWNTDNNQPSEKQLININEKITAVSAFFNIPESKVVPVSSDEKYNLVKLVDEIVYSLPNEQLLTFASHVKPENISPEAQKYVAEKTGNYILAGTATGATIGASVAGPVGAAVGAAAGFVVGIVASLFG